MRVDIPPGTYVITPAGVDNPVVGMTPLLRARQNHGAQPLAECKPVELVPDNYPEYTRVWELAEDGTLALSFMGEKLYARKGGRGPCLGPDPEEWSIVTFPDTPYGPCQVIHSKDGFVWFLPNTNVGTQPELTSVPIVHPPPPQYLFHFQPVNVE